MKFILRVVKASVLPAFTSIHIINNCRTQTFLMAHESACAPNHGSSNAASDAGIALLCMSVASVRAL